MKQRIKIKKAPQYAQGGPNWDQTNYAFDPGVATSQDTGGGSGATQKYIPEADPEFANVIAERGETVLTDADKDGQLEQFEIGGKKHEQGGTPLQLNPGDFIFSDRKKMALKGEIVKNFGKSNVKKPFTPAELARQYDINRYKKVLNDPESDPIQKRTAEKMIANYTQKLGELATVQEAMKGKPTPQFAQPQPEEPSMAAGGFVAATGFEFPPDKTGKWAGDKNDNWNAMTSYKSMQDYADAVGFTGKINISDPKAIEKSARAIQQFVMGKHPELVKRYHKELGMPIAGRPDDGKLGVRWERIADRIRSMQPAEKISSRVPINGNITMKPWEIPATPVTEPVVNNEQVTTQAQTQTQPTPEEGMPWWKQDVINNAAAVANRYNIKKYMPWEPVFNPVLPDPTFLDPTRQLNANAEQANMQTLAAGMIGDPTRQRLAGSQIQGQAATNAGNILAQYDNSNVGIANQFAGARADIQNNANMQNLAAKKRLYDGNVIANDQFDKEKKMATDMMRKQLNNGITNSQKSYWNNKLSEQYSIDPWTGKMVFKKARPFDFNGGGGEGSPDPLKVFNELKGQYKDVPDNILWEHAKTLLGIGKNSQTDKNADGVVDQSRFTGPGANPYIPTFD